MNIYKLDDYDYYIGESLESCIKYARESCGEDCYEGAETDGFQLSDSDLDRINFMDEDGTERSLKEQRDLEVKKGGDFPRLFASTEY